MSGNGSAQSLLQKAQIAGVIAAVIGLGACIAAKGGGHGVYHRYLSAYMFWLGLGIGAMGLLLVSHLIHGSWNLLARRTLEAMTWTIPVMAVLGIGVVLGMNELYPWMNPAEIAGEMKAKAPYLNAPFF